jgi:hypothetical protein
MRRVLCVLRREINCIKRAWFSVHGLCENPGNHLSGRLYSLSCPTREWELWRERPRAHHLGLILFTLCALIIRPEKGFSDATGSLWNSHSPSPYPPCMLCVLKEPNLISAWPTKCHAKHLIKCSHGISHTRLWPDLKSISETVFSLSWAAAIKRHEITLCNHVTRYF